MAQWEIPYIPGPMKTIPNGGRSDRTNGTIQFPSSLVFGPDSAFEGQSVLTNNRWGECSHTFFSEIAHNQFVTSVPFLSLLQLFVCRTFRGYLDRLSRRALLRRSIDGSDCRPQRIFPRFNPTRITKLKCLTIVTLATGYHVRPGPGCLH